MSRKQAIALLWSGIRESNPRLKLGKLAYYHCTNPAQCEVTIHKTDRAIYGAMREKNATSHGVIVVRLAGLEPTAFSFGG